MPSGFDSWQPDQGMGKTTGSGGGIKRLFLRQDDVAEVRFMNDGSEIYWDRFHTITSDDGKFNTIRCIGEEVCPHCANKNFPGSIFFTWVYVRRILHANTQPEYIKTVTANVNGRKVYVQEVNAPRVFECRFGKSNSRWNTLMSLFHKYQTLCDRDYDIKRVGARKEDTDYNFIPGDKTGPDEEVVKMLSLLPLIDDVAVGAVSEQPLTENKAAAPAGSDERVPMAQAARPSASPLMAAEESLDMPSIPEDEDDDEGDFKGMF